MIMSEKPNQKVLAKKLGISNSYLSMILSGKRKGPSELVESLQSTRGIHKIVKNNLWKSLYTQEVRGPNPLPPTISLDDRVFCPCGSRAIEVRSFYSVHWQVEEIFRVLEGNFLYYLSFNTHHFHSQNYSWN